MEAHASRGESTRQGLAIFASRESRRCPYGHRRYQAEDVAAKKTRLSRAEARGQLPRRFAHRGWQASAIWRRARYFVYNRRLMLSQEPAE
jgi:hypothetical protein